MALVPSCSVSVNFGLGSTPNKRTSFHRGTVYRMGTYPPFRVLAAWSSSTRIGHLLPTILSPARTARPKTWEYDEMHGPMWEGYTKKNSRTGFLFFPHQ